MIRTLLIKEFQELALWGGVLLGLMVLATINLAGTNPFTLQMTEEFRNIPFASSDGKSGLMLYGSMAAIALAMRQTVGETVQGTWLFLLHRVGSRRRVIAVKILSGIITLLLVTGIPFLGYTFWAAAPGTHASPFRWEFVLPTFATWLQLSVVYLGAFLCGLRNARWLGSRLLPLIPTFVLLTLCSESIQINSWVIPMAVALAGNVLLLTGIDFVAETRDFS